MLGSECITLYQQATKGQYNAASHLQLRLIGPNKVITKEYGVPGLKVAMQWYGLSTGDLREPLMELDDNEAEIIRQTFMRTGFIGSKASSLKLSQLSRR